MTVGERSRSLSNEGKLCRTIEQKGPSSSAATGAPGPFPQRRAGHRAFLQDVFTEGVPLAKSQIQGMFAPCGVEKTIQGDGGNRRPTWSPVLCVQWGLGWAEAG